MVSCNNFTFWCQKILPLVYDESISYYEVLCKLTEYLKEMFATQENFNATLTKLDMRVEVLEKAFPELQQEVKDGLDYMYEELDKIKNGDYIDLYLDSLKSYIDQNLQNFVKDIVKYVNFGISQDGHFVAYIPDSWDFLGFDTGDYDTDFDGQLILRW